MLRLPLGRGSGERYLILETKGFDELRDIDVFQQLNASTVDNGLALATLERWRTIAGLRG